MLKDKKPAIGMICVGMVAIVSELTVVITRPVNYRTDTATQTALDGKQNVLIFDNAPTENSNNPVKSGGVYSALAGKISTSEKGAAGGVAELDANGKIPSSQMPAAVDVFLITASLPMLMAYSLAGETLHELWIVIVKLFTASYFCVKRITRLSLSGE